MDKRKVYFYSALIVTLVTVTLLVSGSSLLTIALDKDATVPLGTFITWAGMISLPLTIYWGIKEFRKPTSSLNTFLSGLLKMVIILGILWVPLSWLLAGNISFTFSEKETFQGGQLAMRLFWWLSYGITAGAFATLFLYWITLLFKRKKAAASYGNKTTKFLIILFCGFISLSLNGQSTSGELRIYPDLLYTSSPENDSLQRLNLVLPPESDVPLLIWIGGGAWSYTDRHVEMEFARRMAEDGIAVASVGHRLSPAIWRNPAWTTGVQHPAHIRDIAAAVKWLYEHATNYGYNRDKLFIGGYSSGAHLAALISLDPTWLGEVSLAPDIFKGLLPFSGAFDIAGYHQGFIDRDQPELAIQHVQAVFGDNPAVWKQASPVSFIDNLSMPMLIIADNNVYAYTSSFEDSIRETSFRNVKVMYAYDLSHADLWRNLSNIKTSIYRQAAIKFIREHAGDRSD